MRIIHTTSLLLISGMALLLTSCSSNSGVRVTQGSEQISAPTPGTIVASSSSTVVHVDLFERVATIRNGHGLPDDFLIAKNRRGKQTGILKARPSRAEGGLRTADILEGEPGINNIITPASASESARLSKIYRDADSETE
ncbi:MAG: hypothetical protein ACSHX8_09660 [Opitutaceae bacterium]